MYVIPELDVRVGCNWCDVAVEGAVEPAEAADYCRIFHYPSLLLLLDCCDEVAS